MEVRSGKDPDKKEQPLMVPYSDLHQAARKRHLFISVVRAVAISLDGHPLHDPPLRPPGRLLSFAVVTKGFKLALEHHAKLAVYMPTDTSVRSST